MKSIPVSAPQLEPQDLRAVQDCLESGWVSSEGPQVARFEEALAQAFGRRHGVAVSSGTAALDVAMRALGLAAGDEVLVPSLTIISCAQAIVNAGARPVPVECDLRDWNSWLHHFEERFTSRTRALMLVHLYGLCADLDPILAWAREKNLLVIEDASQVQGLSYRGRPCGSFGDISIFSLYANKAISTGEGGVIVCDSDALEKRCRSLRNLCFDPENRFWHEEMGWNYRMTAMQAALGLPQVGRLREIAQRKRAQGLVYHEALAREAHIAVAPESLPHALNAYWVFGIVVSPEAPFTRKDMLQALADAGIGCRTFFYGLHQQPALLGPGLVDPVLLPATEMLARQGFYLPGGLGLSREDQERVIDVARSFLHRFQ